MGVILETCANSAAILDVSVDPFVEDWCSSFLDADDIENILEGESSRPNQDGQIAAGTLIAAGTGEVEHLISQYQPNHDQATQLGEMKKKEKQNPRTFDVSKKRRGTPLDDEEKKERKKITDQKYRAKAKGTKNELQAADNEVKRLQIANKLLIEIKREIFLEFQNAVTKNGKLQYKNKKLKDHIGKMEEELQGLKGINASLMAEKEATKDSFPNGLKQSCQEERVLDFEGDGGSIMYTEMSRQANAEEARNDRAEPTTQMLEGLPEMRAVEARLMVAHVKSRNVNSS